MNTADKIYHDVQDFPEPLALEVLHFVEFLKNKNPSNKTNQAIITEPALLIRTSRLFKEGMTDKELYEITRGVWKIGSDREKAEYAFCVAKGIVQEIYSIQEWQPAGTATYETSAMKDANTKFKWKGRWEFNGKLAPDTIRKKYIGRSIAHYFDKGNANPINYLNIK